jgi:ribosomal protein L7/L12
MTAALVTAAACMLVMTVSAALNREWWAFGVGALAVASTVAAVWTDGRSRSAAETSTAASADWTPESVRSATSGSSNRVEAVKRFREADRRLSLLDAKRLVDRYAGF